MYTIFLLVLALLPCLLLLRFILYMDRNEKEPLALVVKTMGLGALSVIPVAVIEYFLGILPIYGGGKILSAITTSFVQVAWIEELAKLGVVLLVAWKSKDFNEENDGIVYVGASALGFAMLENIVYVMSRGIGTGILRSLTAVPLHCFTGVIMGYYLGKAKFSNHENEKIAYIWKGFLLAYIIHGVYDALIMTNTPAALLILPLIVILIVFGVKIMKKSRESSIVRSREGAATLEAAGEVTAPLGIEEPVPVPAAVTTAPPLAEQRYPTDAHIIYLAHPKKQIWKAIVSRTLLVISGLFWLMIIIGLVAKGKTLEARPQEIILGGILFSFLPILVGLLLEFSYRKRRALFQAAKERQATMPQDQGMVEVLEEVSPPGQLWLAVIARTLMGLAALFWISLIMGALANAEESPSVVLEALLGGTVISMLPIYAAVAMEMAYRAKKKIYNQLLKTKTAGEIRPIDLRQWPVNKLWKLIVSRLLLMIGSLLWLLFLFDLLGSQAGVISGEPERTIGFLVVTLPMIVAGVVLDISYRKAKKAYLLSKNAAPTIPPAHDPRVPITTDEEFSEYSRKLKSDRDEDRFYYQKRE